LKPLVLLSINTGMRRGELFKLMWNDVDFTHRVLNVRASATKSNRPRKIILNSEALAVLEGWHGMSADVTGLVFPGEAGKILTNTKRSWAAVLTDAGITNFRWHDLRHHFATRLSDAGVNLNTVAKLMGHADIRMTQRYAHVPADSQRRALDILCSGKE
jgi:integrase